MGGFNNGSAARAHSETANPNTCINSLLVATGPTGWRMSDPPVQAAGPVCDVTGRAAAEENFSNLHSQCALRQPLSGRDDF